MLIFLAVLGGCEAKLDLSGVEKSEQQAVKRSDQFLAAAENDQALVIVGRRGVVLTSFDRGESWQRQQLTGDTVVDLPNLVDITACPDGNFIALDTNRKIWLGGADARTWTSKKIDTPEEVVDLACDATGAYWVVGSFTLILKSQDQGQSWQDMSIGEDALLSRIQFVTPEHAVITGEFGVVYTSEDGGKSWFPTGPVPNEFYSAASYFRTSQQGWVGGLQGIILYTEDGGKSWNRQKTGTSSPIYRIFENGKSLIALGDQGTILSLHENEWRPLTVEGLGFGYLRAAVPLEDGQFLVAGGNGLLRTIH
ncbi:WD40/YVTN/BNR-like repeat-containing protein [Emcibacter nanhaiensis]|uniref:Glycosyl hydrolase n=1 Tax=Emcibacter nanhaiensis TaxID=1505037 RepID=A0A501PL22_9PROT|nr:YCF48-related protein [Emcibacter nanhaiensis]TPD60767.1 glycosyl hydrolase [Emcibacter nanhaiensis]